MARFVSGSLKLNKGDVKALETLIWHTEKDISYGWDGTYGGYDEKDIRDKKRAHKEIELSKEALSIIRLILGFRREA